MCDTLYKKTKTGFFFAKNSDRSPNEPNLSIFIPRTKTSETLLPCTYITIDQVPETNAVVLVKPSWMWGAEMGINEFGVCIGNEAVFTRAKTVKKDALTGMDLLRLALERCSTAKQSLDCIIELLVKYGQGGNCGFDKHFYYDNSFLIADKEEAYILETSGKDWVYKTIHEEGNISNRLQTRSHYDASSKGKGYDFAKRLTEPIFTFFSKSLNREHCVMDKIKLASPDTLEAIMEALRSHEFASTERLYTSGSMGSVCMHKSMLGDHTTSSMIIDYTGKDPILWMTSASTPCLTLYKPVFFGSTQSVVFKDETKALEYWLKQEYLKRAIYAGLVNHELYQLDMSKRQNQMNALVNKMTKNAGSDFKTRLQNDCFKLEADWLVRFEDAIEKIKSDNAVVVAPWKKLNQRLGLYVFERSLEKRLEK